MSAASATNAPAGAVLAKCSTCPTTLPACAGQLRPGTCHLVVLDDADDGTVAGTVDAFRGRASCAASAIYHGWPSTGAYSDPANPGGPGPLNPGSPADPGGTGGTGGGGTGGGGPADPGGGVG